MTDNKEYTIYIIRGINPLEKGLYVGMSENFTSRKYMHKFHASKPDAKQYVDRYIFENGGWDQFLCYAFDKVTLTKQEVLEYEGDLINRFGGNLNLNRSGVDSVENFGEYYLAWKADYQAKHDLNYHSEWRKKNPGYYKRYYRMRNPETEEKRNNRILKEFMTLAKMKLF